MIVQFPRVQFQPNSKDCGVYALAFVTDLSHGIEPSSRKYSHSKEALGSLFWNWSNETISINTICQRSTLDSDNEYLLLLQDAVCIKAFEIRFYSSW